MSRHHSLARRALPDGFRVRKSIIVNNKNNTWGCDQWFLLDSMVLRAPPWEDIDVNTKYSCQHSLISGMSDTPPPPPAESPEQNGAFTRWRRKLALITGLGVTEEERMQDLRLHHLRHCEEKTEYLMNYSPAVVFMLKHLKLSGCEVTPKNIICAPCDMTRAGGYSPEHEAVVLCAGHFFSQTHMEHTLVHELVHMYDHCKFKVDWKNLRHHACSEIRANNLSGDCRYTRELRRGFVAFSKQHQACVRRRAAESVAENPACPNPATAERVVNEVWDSCFNDTRPFDEIY